MEEDFLLAQKKLRLHLMSDFKTRLKIEILQRFMDERAGKLRADKSSVKVMCLNGWCMRRLLPHKRPDRRYSVFTLMASVNSLLLIFQLRIGIHKAHLVCKG